MYRVRAAALAAFAATGIVASAHGQDRAALQRHADRLLSAYQHAVAIAARRDTVRSAQVPVDTIRVGGLRIVAVPSVAGRARAGADSAWVELAEMFGGAAQALDRLTLVINVFGQPEGDIRTPSPAAYVNAPQDADADVLRHALVSQGANQMSQRQDSTLRDWLRGTLLPPLRASGRFDVVYENLATSPFSKPQACFVGDRAACRAALGLTEQDPIVAWYDAIDRRRLAATWSDFARRTGHPAVVRCAEGASDSVCIAALRELPAAVRLGEPPLSGGDRVSLAAMALDVGGPGAYDRLLAARGQPIADRLAAAARLDADSLIGVWRARVIAARPHTLAFQPRAAWAAVLWGTLLGFMALRSTRWR